MSVLQQGSSQALILQPIQFGDGGNHPIYLNLDSTAIEFPAQYNVDTKNVFYNSVDNAVGLTYYAGASDTIKHTDSVISSANKYYWAIHASSSASASYDFAGLAIIGAGTITLRAVTTFDSMAITDCPTVTQNGATITNTDFDNSRLTATNPAVISHCSFVSAGTGHAIEITTAGTYSFAGNVFNSYAATNGSTGNEAIYNNSGGLVTLNISAGGSTPTIRNGTGASTVLNNVVSLTLTGIVDGTEVRMYKVSDGTEVYGIENSVGNVVYNYNYSADVVVNITIFKEHQLAVFIMNLKKYLQFHLL